MVREILRHWPNALNPGLSVSPWNLTAGDRGLCATDHCTTAKAVYGLPS
jgi:hypothetical protein